MLLVLCAASCLGIQNDKTANACKQAATREQEKQRISDLKVVAQALVKSLQDADTRAFLDLASRGGIGLEHDVFTFARIKTSLERKDWIYCWLFDTQCLRKVYRENYGGVMKVQSSFQEILTTVTITEIDTHFSQEGFPGKDTCWGEAIVRYKRGAPPHYVTFIFKYGSEKWRLTSIPDLPWAD